MSRSNSTLYLKLKKKTHILKFYVVICLETEFFRWGWTFMPFLLTKKFKMCRFWRKKLTISNWFLKIEDKLKLKEQNSRERLHPQGAVSPPVAPSRVKKKPNLAHSSHLFRCIIIAGCDFRFSDWGCGWSDAQRFEPHRRGWPWTVRLQHGPWYAYSLTMPFWFGSAAITKAIYWHEPLFLFILIWQK